MEKLEAIKELVSKIKEPRELPEDHDPSDGGNFDDTFEDGRNLGDSEGQYDLVQKILAIITS